MDGSAGTVTELGYQERRDLLNFCNDFSMIMHHVIHRVICIFRGRSNMSSSNYY